MSEKKVRVVLAGGRQKADFLISLLLEKGFELTVINEDRTYCEYLAGKYGIPIFRGRPESLLILDEANIHGADILISLMNNDSDNFVVCQAARKLFNISRIVATVSSPKNVEVFKQLGINTVVSATYTVATIIEQASVVGDIVNTLSLDDEKVVISKITVKEDSPILGKQIMDIEFPSNVIISCIIRETGTTVPSGQTLITLGDKLLIISDKSLQRQVIGIVTGHKK